MCEEPAALPSQKTVATDETGVDGHPQRIALPGCPRYINATVAIVAGKNLRNGAFVVEFECCRRIHCHRYQNAEVVTSKYYGHSLVI